MDEKYLIEVESLTLAALPEPEKNIRELMEAAKNAKATASPAACQQIDKALVVFEETGEK
jgi:ribosomal protein L12E/L44/L45/RPP1/RPP2